MMGLPNPYLIIGAIVAAIALYFYGHHEGWDERDKEMQIEIAKQNEKARATENKLNEQLNASTSQLMEANNAVNKKQSDLDRAIRAGRLRLPATGCVSVPASSAPTGGDSKEAGNEPAGQVHATADAERATLEAIAEIIAQGQRNTEQLNACIDAYNTIREQLNGKR